MTLRDAVHAAFQGLSRHWLRATLNTIGIFAGVASIVLLLSVASGVRRAATAQVEGLGANLVVVYPSGVSSSGIQVGIGTESSLSLNDATALNNQAYVPDSVQAVPTAGMRATVVAFNHTWQTDVLGTTDGFAQATQYSIREGSFINAADVESGASVIVLGATVADELFPDSDPLGQSVRVNNHPFVVDGVFAPRGYSGSYNQDDLAVMPISTAWADVLPTSAPRIQQILVEATSPEATSAVKTEVTNTLLARHHILNPTLADFQVKTQQDLVSSAQRLGTMMQWMLGAIAVIALLTGSIGIMSLQLISVGERAYEIGIRRAVGARRADIMGQFLGEALLLACMGAVVGIALGVGAANFVGLLLTDVPAPIVSLGSILIAIAVALVIGAGAGLYPAARAALLQPVEAMRRQ